MVEELFRTSGIRLVLKAARNIPFDKRHLRRRNILPSIAESTMFKSPTYLEKLSLPDDRIFP